MKKRILALTLTAAMTFTLFAGCKKADNTDTTAGTSGKTEQTTAPQGEKLAAKQEMQLHWNGANFRSFDNHANYAAEEIQVQSQIREGLVRPTTDENGNQVLAPAGAESWTTSDDVLVQTFESRDHSWRDGVKVMWGSFQVD